MPPILSDPHNHAPDVKPEDEWGDAEAAAAIADTFALLPPKRIKIEPAVPEESNVGLRIDARTRAESVDASRPRIEVVELDASVVRLQPAEQPVMKAPRQVVFQEMPAGFSTKRPSKDVAVEWGREKKHSLSWIVGIPLLVAVLICACVFLLPWLNRVNQGTPNQDELVMEPEVVIEGIEIANDLVTRQPEAERIFRSYATSSDAGGIVTFIRDSESIKPLVIASRHHARAPADWVLPTALKWSVMSGEEHPYGILEGTLPDYSRFCAYFVPVGNRLLLDWKATKGYGTATFAELAAGCGDPAEIRGTIQPSDYYTAVFPESGYRSFQLLSPDDQKAVWCYTRRDQAADVSLARLFLQGDILDNVPTTRKVTLRLDHAPEGALANQWLVAELLDPEWISNNPRPH